jgi:plastocyanin
MEPVGDKAVADPRTAEIDQVHLRFVPDVVVVSPGSEVRFLNSDPLMHNVFGPGIRDGAVFDLGTYPQGLYGSWTFQREGLHYVLCHIHPEMVAYVVVTESPFHAVTNGDGTFSIDEVPPGLYDVTLWHPRRSRETTTVRLNVPEGGIGDVRLTLGDTVARLGGDP